MSDRRYVKTVESMQRHSKQAGGRRKGGRVSIATTFTRQVECDRARAGTAQIADIAATESAGTSTTFAGGDHVHNCARHDTIPAVVNAAGLNIASTKLLAFVDGGSVDIIRDEDTLVSDDVNALATQQSVKAYVDKANMIGAANKTWVPCLVSEDANTPLIHGTTSYRFTEAGTFYLMCHVPLPTNRGGLKLYCKDVKINMIDAAAEDYIDEVWIRGINQAASATVYTNTVDFNSVKEWNTADEATPNAAADDMSSYSHVWVILKCIVATATDLDFGLPQVECYYAS